MSVELAILLLLATIVAEAVVAAYYVIRFEQVQEKLLESDDLASARATEIQYLQMQIEVMKGRGR